MTDRFKLMRCGLISLFHYANQVFDAEDGHLLLRGSNGSGKSTAMELVMPLLFDGNLSASNLSTSDGQRSIAYHLLLDGQYTRRLGYSWVQFAQLDPDGAERWVTLALGVKMSTDSRHDPWFLVWDTPVMIDPHVMLVGESAPLGRKEAAKLPDVEVFDSAEEYRARVNGLLFGFSERRYLAMIKLMRRLRSAQLGKSIDVAQTTQLLELALPEIDAELLGGVGGKLDELESLRTELAALREADGAASAFVARYRDFARGVLARELGAADDVVRAARRAAKKEVELDGLRHLAEDAVGRAEQDLVAIGEETARTQGELEALRASERWQAVEQVDSARRQASEQRERAKRADRRVDELLAEVTDSTASLAAAEAELAAAEASVAQVGETLRDACGRSGLADLLELPLEPSTVEVLDGARRARRSAVRGLVEREAAASRAREDEARVREALEGLEAAERDLRGRRDELEAVREAAQRALAEAVAAWAGELSELRLERGERAALLRRAEDLSDRRRDLSSCLEGPTLRATRAFAVEEEQCRARREELEGQSAALASERRDLVASKDAPPPFAPWRDASQAGTPLWRLCEFAPDVDDDARSGLERALEACGLLDARADETGTLRAEHGHVLLAAAAGVPAETPSEAGAESPRAAGVGAGAEPLAAGVGAGAEPLAAGFAAGAGSPEADARRAGAAAGGRTLADVLSGPAALRPALAAVAVLDRDARDGLAVALDGTFSLGPLRGRGAAGPARFIGAAARQAARERRVAEIDAATATIDSELEAVDGALAELARRASALEADRATLPAREVDAVVEAWAAWRDLGRELEAQRGRLTAQREAAKAATEHLIAADAALTRHASDHGLPQVPSILDDALEQLSETLPEARTRLAQRDRWASTRTERAERHARVTARHERAAEEAAGERRQSEQLGAFSERLVASAGADRDEVLSDAKALDAALAQLAHRRVELDKEARVETGNMERRRAERDAAAADLERRLRRQDQHVARLAELDRAGLVSLALATSEEPSAWDAARIASVWRGWQADLASAPEVSANAIYREFDTLRATLDASLGVEAMLEPIGDVPLVTAAYGGDHVPIASAAAALASELERQELTLAGREQDLFEEFLFGDVANELRARISDADEIARAASDKIAGVRTSSGVGVDLQWELRPDLDASVRSVIGLLRRSDPRALPVDQRETLMEFFRARLAEARAGEEQATLVEHLQFTLDYRQWFRFRIFQIKDGDRTELTRRAHSRDSGGEKSVTLHLPLLAAYHALLTGAQAHAPRLVALDEAFAGIDRTGQQQLLEVLDDKFDMDFMLTSEKLWCFEPQVHRLGVYQLRRFDGAPVAAVHWRWWGDERRKEMVTAEGVVEAGS